MEDKRCMRCRVDMDCIGVKEFRTGGRSGGWHLILGDFADMGEQKMKLEIWVCPHCRRVEFYLPDK